MFKADPCDFNTDGVFRHFRYNIHHHGLSSYLKITCQLTVIIAGVILTTCPLEFLVMPPRSEV